VPASFTLTSGDSATPTLDPVTSTETTETPEPTETTEPTESADPSTGLTTDPTVDPTRGWEVEHPNNGLHQGWENGNHDHGVAVRDWAKCVSTQGKDNCPTKPESNGQLKKQAGTTTDSTTDPTTEPTTDSTTEPTEGD